MRGKVKARVRVKGEGKGQSSGEVRVKVRVKGGAYFSRSDTSTKAKSTLPASPWQGREAGAQIQLQIVTVLPTTAC